MMYKTQIEIAEKCQILEAKNAELQNRIDEQQKCIEELHKMINKRKSESNYWQARCDEKERELQIRDAQMEVVRMIFERR